MNHQLNPNTYCILSPTDCKKWFEWAKKNGIETSGMYYSGNKFLSYYNDVDFGNILVCLTYEDSCNRDCVKIPADEFLLRLQGNWEETDKGSVALENWEWQFVLKGLEHANKVEGVDSRYELLATAIKQQLNKQP